MSEIHDQELVKEYAMEKSDRAFRTLVERHAGLVYSTAFRLAGDRGIAEEIMQDVFVALARKAGRLSGDATVAGWLYRTTVLEARHHLRAELRRKKRETSAAELAVAAHEGESIWSRLVPLLDEALMHLRESDRLAVLLRFFEDRTLREVGGALRISEDAAQKRVSKSLDLLSDFFRQRGFAVPSAAAFAGVFAEASHAVPSGATQMVTHTALAHAAATSAAGLGLWVTKVMTLTKTQTAVVCLLASAVPIAWEWSKVQERRAERAWWVNQIAGAHAKVSELESQWEQLRTRRGKLEQAAVRQRLATQTAAGKPPQTTTAKPDSYRWSEASDFVRLPKSLLGRISLPVVSRDFRVKEEIIQALDLTPGETEGVQQSFSRAAEQFRALADAQTTVTDQHVNKLPGEDAVTIHMSAFPEQGKSLRSQLWSELAGTVGEERARLLWDQAQKVFWDKFDDFGAREHTYTLVRDRAHPTELHIRERRVKAGDDNSWEESSHGGSGEEIKHRIPPALRATYDLWVDEGKAAKAVQTGKAP